MALSDSAGNTSNYSNYIFNRDDRSTTRLNYQHWLIKQLCRYLLHPTIPTQIPGIRVADIGTGTGIWPTELSQDLPASARLDGFDTSSSQFPLQAWLPANLHLHVHDAFTPFAPEHVGAYDVVHLRFFSTLLNQNNVTMLLDNLITLLKPGGVLQWVDMDMLSSRIIAAASTTMTSATESLVALMRKPHPNADYNWIPHLSETFSQHGWEAVSIDHIPMMDQYRGFWNQNYLMGYEDYWVRRESENPADQVSQAREAVTTLSEEFGRGVSVDINFFCVIARKPQVD